MEDNVKELVEKLRKKAIIMTSAAETTIREAGRKTAETVGIARLNMKIFDLNGEIELNYKRLGELVYATHLGKEVSDDEIDELIADIDAKKSEIEQYRDRINLLKKSVVCPMCHENCGKDDRFCKKCGVEL